MLLYTTNAAFFTNIDWPKWFFCMKVLLLLIGVENQSIPVYLS